MTVRLVATCGGAVAFGAGLGATGVAGGGVASAIFDSDFAADATGGADDETGGAIGAAGGVFTATLVFSASAFAASTSAARKLPGIVGRGASSAGSAGALPSTPVFVSATASLASGAGSGVMVVDWTGRGWAPITVAFSTFAEPQPNIGLIARRKSSLCTGLHLRFICSPPEGVRIS